MRKYFLLLAAAFMALSSMSCAHYHVVELESFVDPQNPDGVRIHTYAVAKNNMVIPELSIDRRGNYPTTAAEAKQRFEIRREALSLLVQRKYKTENSFLYQSRRIFFAVGFTFVSPAVFLVEGLSTLLSPKPRQPPASWGKDYFNVILNYPVPRKPVLRDAFEAVLT